METTYIAIPVCYQSGNNFQRPGIHPFLEKSNKPSNDTGDRASIRDPPPQSSGGDNKPAFPSRVVEQGRPYWLFPYRSLARLYRLSANISSLPSNLRVRRKGVMGEKIENMEVLVFTYNRQMEEAV
ncbi:hypothetical protein K0M31_011216 [Melipona bicolor]|uniref:Uncharacterized protein n=1 Tax=Melipona bicolor TaxID=60889 RepID=A0AA40G944_9HYME|nr:hypothetical protein K0M31_011216 [Melipona bicolor]